MNSALAEHGFVIRPGLMDSRFARILFDMLRLRTWRREDRRDTQVPAASSHWGDSTLDAILLGMRSDIEAVTSCELLPTYSYARLYGPGDELSPHRDRAEAEVAVSIHLGFSGTPPPPICFSPGIEVHQDGGDGVVYLGDQIEHWRDRFEGESFGQMFLNYVRADGQRRHRVHDGRHEAYPPSLRFTSWQAV